MTSSFSNPELKIEMTSKILAQLNDKMKELPSEQNRARFIFVLIEGIEVSLEVIFVFSYGFFCYDRIGKEDFIGNY
uniref:Uncharacterized protein n=1 Tax=Salix viminalis TaxID=40686 RepID=A0A6N2LFP3_SALVM